MSKLIIDEVGTLTMIYADELRPLLLAGQGTIVRASHVEPTDDGKWTADMSPVGGPLLGPFETRAEALRTEVQYLEERIL